MLAIFLLFVQTRNKKIEKNGKDTKKIIKGESPVIEYDLHRCDKDGDGNDEDDGDANV